MKTHTPPQPFTLYLKKAPLTKSKSAQNPTISTHHFVLCLNVFNVLLSNVKSSRIRKRESGLAYFKPKLENVVQTHFGISAFNLYIYYAYLFFNLKLWWLGKLRLRLSSAQLLGTKRVGLLK